MLDDALTAEPYELDDQSAAAALAGVEQYLDGQAYDALLDCGVDEDAITDEMVAELRASEAYAVDAGEGGNPDVHVYYGADPSEVVRRRLFAKGARVRTLPRLVSARAPRRRQRQRSRRVVARAGSARPRPAPPDDPHHPARWCR